MPPDRRPVRDCHGRQVTREICLIYRRVVLWVGAPRPTLEIATVEQWRQLSDCGRGSRPAPVAVTDVLPPRLSLPSIAQIDLRDLPPAPNRPRQSDVFVCQDQTAPRMHRMILFAKKTGNLSSRKSARVRASASTHAPASAPRRSGPGSFVIQVWPEPQSPSC